MINNKRTYCSSILSNRFFQCLERGLIYYFTITKSVNLPFFQCLEEGLITLSLTDKALVTVFSHDSTDHLLEHDFFIN